MSELRKTAHQMRCEQVRERVRRVVSRIPKEIRKGGFTKTGVFAERVWEIAVERDLPLSKMAHPDSKRTAGGIPRNLVTQINYFMSSKTGAYETRLDAYELTCIEFETEWREARQERRHQLTVVTDPPFVYEPSEAVTEPQNALQAAKTEAALTTFAYVATRNEFQAAGSVVEVLRNYDARTVKRIMRYVEIALEERSDA